MSGYAPWPEPFAAFGDQLAMAKAVDPVVLPEPTAFSLGTVSDTGQPAVRILLLKGFDERGFVFYTNYESRKGKEMLRHDKVAMCFHWQPFERQVRIEGVASPVTGAEADEYFASRARGSQIGAWASLQSQPLKQTADLTARVREIEARFHGVPVTRPPHWSGFRVLPSRIEFWHGMPSRLHERHVYITDGNRWRTEILYP
ncbi:MAG: pyridoxamine 5'-phosphate oxidase [bacterium]